MWTKDTLASDVVAAHKAHLGRVNPKLMEKGCAGLAWCDALIAVNPDITIGQMLVHGEQALKSGDAHSDWPLDLLAAQNAQGDEHIMIEIDKVHLAAGDRPFGCQTFYGYFTQVWIGRGFHS